MGADSGINVLYMSIFTWCFGDIVVFSVVGVTLWVLDDGAACYSDLSILHLKWMRTLMTIPMPKRTFLLLILIYDVIIFSKKIFHLKICIHKIPTYMRKRKTL